MTTHSVEARQPLVSITAFEVLEMPATGCSSHTLVNHRSGKDFDFGHGGAQPNQQQQQTTKKPMDSMFASNFDDFWALPSFGGGQRQQQQQQIPPPVPQLQAPAVSQYEHQAPQPAPARPGLTMEEIEAELRAARVSQQQQQQAPPPSQPAGPPGRHQMSVEEIEAQMRGGQHRQAGPPLPTQQQQQGMFPQGMPPGMPPQFAAMMQGQQGQYRGQPHPSQQPFPAPTGPAGPRQDRMDSDFPPLGAPPPPGADSSPPPPAHSNIPLHRPQQPMPGPPPPVLSAEAMREQDEQRLARMRALLNALPEPVQQGIISLPPQMHFDVLMGISREFPVLLEPRTSVVEDAQKQAQEAALRRLGKIAEVRNKIAQREAKIAAMSRYNNVMSVSDKEFITRIQISQIITADPYADDFYAHIYFALRNNRSLVNPGLMGAPPGAAAPGPNQQQQQPPKGPKNSKGSQRMNAQQKAMLRMQQQVERLVADRKQRIEKATSGSVNPNLQGALGKVGGNSASNPRKALQISRSEEDGDGQANGKSAADAVRQALEGASLGGRGGGESASADGRRAPLTRHESLRILEKLYDTLLSLEQLRRSLDGPSDEAGQAAAREQQEALVATLWKELRILEPLEISDPHPFVSLLGTTKGKRLLPRALRHLSSEQTLTALTMIVASFDTLDVVRDAALLDDVSSFIPGTASAPSPAALTKRRDVEEQSELFGTTIVPAMLVLMGSSPMKIVIGMLALFVERNDVVKVVRSRAGIAFLTILLSRAATLRSQTSASTTDGGDAAVSGATPEEQAQWSSIFQLLFERLVTGSGGLSNLFPSSRAKSNLPFGLSNYLLQQSSNPYASSLQSHLDEVDESIWNLYAALAINATSSNSMEQQSILVQELREKILENVLEARNKRDTLDGERKLRLVNIFLNALNLDASQITF